MVDASTSLAFLTLFSVLMSYSLAIPAQVPSPARSTEVAVQPRADWADFALTTSGTLVSLGFLVVTGDYYSKTFGRRSPLKIDATSPPDNPDASEKTIATREIGVFAGKDFYPLIINAVGIVLSGAGLAATTLAHLKMEKQYHPHPQSSHASRLVDLDSATSEKRGLVDTMLKSPNLPKAIELLAGTVSLTSIPITFENVMAIGEKPKQKTDPKARTKQRR
ncbi:hypothetical protein OC845_002133 [Tilletia horrida]|nr:hypothetical protein OC845_002133 [Tilletia horrida]